MSSNTGMLGSLKQAFHVGGHKKQPTTPPPTETVDNTSPLSSGARQLDDPLPASSTADAPPASMHTTHTSTATRAGPTLDPAADGTGAAGGMDGMAAVPEGGQNRSAGTAIKEAFTGAPWEARHERTMEALTHAKTAHVKAVQAQAELQAAQKAKQDAELAERHRLELERETAVFTQGQNDLDGRTREYEAAKQALAEHNQNHDNASRLAQEAEAAALAKEEEARGMLPLLEEHERGLGPLQHETTMHQMARAEAEERRAALVRELEALDASLGGHRSREAAALEKLEQHQQLGAGHKERALAAAEEAELLRRKATDANAALQPHAQKLKDAHGVLALRESAYNKARTQAEAGRDRLPMLQQQADEAARAAKASALAAHEHAGAFEKLKREAEIEDAKKTELWTEVQKTGHFTDDNASRTELHNLADRFHTVLKNPIDTGRLAGSGVTTEIEQSVARITGEGTHEGTGMGPTTGGIPAATKTTTMGTDEPVGRTETGPTTGNGLTGTSDSSATGDRSMMGSMMGMMGSMMGSNPSGATTATSEPGMIRKATSVTTPAHATTGAPLREE